MTHTDHGGRDPSPDQHADMDAPIEWAASIRNGAFRYVALPMWMLEAVQTGAMDFTMFGVLCALWLQAKADRDTGVVWASATSLSATWRGLNRKTAQEALARLKTRGFIRELRLPSTRGSYPIVIDGYYICRDGAWLRVNAERTTAWDQPHLDSAQVDPSQTRLPSADIRERKHEAGRPLIVTEGLSVDVHPHEGASPHLPAPIGDRDAAIETPVCRAVNGWQDGTQNGTQRVCHSRTPPKTVDTDTREATHISPATAGGMDEVQVGRVFTPDDLVRLYGRLLPSLPQPGLPLSPGNRKKVAAAIRRHPNPDWWEEYFATVQQRPFLMGSNDRGWQATLTWLCTPRAEDGIAEGRYRTGTRGDAAMNNALRAAQELQVEANAKLDSTHLLGDFKNDICE